MRSSNCLVIRVFFLLSMGLAGCSDHTTTIADIEGLIDGKDYRTAIIELKSRLQHNPKDPRARWLLGTVYLAIEDGASAEKELLAAKSLGVSDDSVQPMLARSLIMQERLRDVMELPSDSTLSTESAAELHASKALAALSLGDQKLAQELITQATAKAPKSPWVRTCQAQMLIAQRDIGTAKEVLQKIVAEDPQNGIAWSLLGSIFRDEGAYKEADNAYSEAIASRGLAAKDRFNRGLMRLALNDLPAAKADADFLKTIAPKSPNTNYLNGFLSFRQAKYADTIDALEATYAADSTHVPTAIMLAISHLQEGNSERANAIISATLATNPDNFLIKQLKVVASLSEGRTERVQSLIEPILSRENNAGLFVKTNTSIAAQPQDLARQMRKEGATQGQTDGSSLAALQSQVMALVKSRQLDEALQKAEEIRALDPKNAVSENLLGYVQLLRGDKETAKQAFSRAIEISPNFAPAIKNLALLDIEEGNIESAHKLVLNSLKGAPNDVSLLLLAAEIDARLGDGDAARQHLESATVSDPNAAEPRIALARYQILQGQHQEEVNILQPIAAGNDDNRNFLLVYGNAQLSSGHSIDAISTFERLTTIEPASPVGYFWLAKSYGDSGDIARMRNALQKSLALDPDYLPAKSAKVGLLIAEKKTAEAEVLLDQLRNEDPKARELPLFSARLAMAKSLPSDALPLYEKALTADPSNWQILVEYSQARWAAGDQDGAKNLIDEWVQNHPRDARALAALGELAIKLGKLADAEKAYAKFVDLDPNNVVALHNLAWLMSQHNPEKAAAYADRAVSVSPDQPEVLDLAAEIALKNGKSDQAVTLYERAINASNGRTDLVLGLAQAQAMGGHTDLAIKTLKALLANSAEFPERNAAEKMLRDLGE